MKQPIDLEGIRARARAATPGPWDDKVTAVYKDNTAIRICGDFTNFDADAFFIAQARQDIPALLDEVERLQGLLDRAAEDLAYMRLCRHCVNRDGFKAKMPPCDTCMKNETTIKPAWKWCGFGEREG